MSKLNVALGKVMGRVELSGEIPTILTLGIHYDEGGAELYDFSRATLEVNPSTLEFTIVARPLSGGHEDDRLVIRCDALEARKVYRIEEESGEAQAFFYMKGVMDNYPTDPEGVLVVDFVGEEDGRYWIQGYFIFTVVETVAPHRKISVVCNTLQIHQRS